jgi:hypothetical protein
VWTSPNAAGPRLLGFGLLFFFSFSTAHLPPAHSR